MAAAEMKPKRIQRKRTQGWRMPPNTVYVGRPSKWGNPFVVKRRFYEEGDPMLYTMATAGEALAAYELNLKRGVLGFTLEDVKRELKGKNLACWCKVTTAPPETCHADILLRLANEEPAHPAAATTSNETKREKCPGCGRRRHWLYPYYCKHCGGTYPTRQPAEHPLHKK